MTQTPQSPAAPAPSNAWLSVITNFVLAVLNKIGVPKKFQVYVVHAVAVFVVALVTQIAVSGFHAHSWSAVWQLVVAAAAAGASAVFHYVLGLFKISL